MLLSLLGLTTTRDRALTLFNLKRSNPGYLGADYCDIEKVLVGSARVNRSRWEYHARFDFASISKSLRAHLRRTGRPTLLTFGAIHRNGAWRCTHVVVVVAATAELLSLLDPLGGRPRARAAANAWLRAGDRPGSTRVVGSSYSVNHESEAAVLHWAAKETPCPKVNPQPPSRPGNK